jgi:hypothetical protein
MNHAPAGRDDAHFVAVFWWASAGCRDNVFIVEINVDERAPGRCRTAVGDAGVSARLSSGFLDGRRPLTSTVARRGAAASAWGFGP